MEENEDISEKQKYLRAEILDEGYDPQEFNDYMCEARKVENIDLENWTLQEIKDIVKSFKEYIKNKENNKNEEEEEINIDEVNHNINTINDEEQEIKQSTNSNLKESISSTQSTAVITNNIFDYYKKSIKCEKLEENLITNRDDLYITISDPERIKLGFFSIAYYQYTVKTFPLNFNVLRKLSDFTFLSQKLPLIHPLVYTPELPTFSFGVRDDSEEKMRFLQNYLNLLIENKFFRSLPIVYDFITLPQNDWNNKVKNNYSKIKLAEQFNLMPNFEGKYKFKITQEDEKKASNIKNDIDIKNEVYNDIDLNFEELLINYDRITLNMKKIALGFNELRKKYRNELLNKSYEFLASLFKTWCEDYILQKNIIRDEMKYFFLFISKELNTFLKNFDDYKLARNDYKKTFDKFKKAKNPTKEDFDLLKSTKKYYAFELSQINSEYDKLEERQGKRLLNQFGKYSDNVKILFQDFQKCCCINKILDKIKNNLKINENKNNEKNIINDNENKEDNNVVKLDEENINDVGNKNENNIKIGNENNIKIGNENNEIKNEDNNKIEIEQTNEIGNNNDKKEININKDNDNTIDLNKKEENKKEENKKEENKTEENKIEENNKEDEINNNNNKIEDNKEKLEKNDEEQKDKKNKEMNNENKKEENMDNNEKLIEKDNKNIINDDKKDEQNIQKEIKEVKNEVNNNMENEDNKINKEIDEKIKENKNENKEKKIDKVENKEDKKNEDIQKDIINNNVKNEADKNNSD